MIMCKERRITKRNPELSTVRGRENQDNRERGGEARTLNSPIFDDDDDESEVFFIEAAFVCCVNDAQNMNANGEVRPPVCFILTDVDFNYGLASALNVADEDRICHCLTDRADIFRNPIDLEHSLVHLMRVTEQVIL
jgi:hypothetical protein